MTGGAGFIGGHLSELILERGGTVTAIDDFSTGSRENVEHLLNSDRFQLVRADVRNESVLDHHASKADVIIHLAAAVGVRLIVERPVHTVETNVLGTEAVLRAALRYGCRVLVASTSEVYGKGSKIPFAEDDDVVLGPTDKHRWAYAASKMIDEFLGLAYHREHGLAVTPFRLFNTVGPRQTGQYGMVIPSFVRAALERKPLRVFGDGKQRRCFCHVRDVVDALYSLAHDQRAVGRLFNIGGSEEISIYDLAVRINELTGNTAGIEMVSYSEAYGPGFEDMMRRVPDTTRIRDLNGWTPKESLESILQSVIDHERRRNG